MSVALCQKTTEGLSFTVLTISNTNQKELSKVFSQMSASQLQYVVLDLTDINTLESPAWFRNIRSSLRQNNMILIGVREPQLNLEVCKALKIPVITSTPLATPLTQTAQNLYIDRTVRSGQQLYAQNGSLIISSHVNSGTELAAKNDIHIYGSANGKLLAGVNGNKSARIYIQGGYPEMVSIAGTILHAEQLSPTTAPAYFYISNGQLKQSAI